MMAVPAATPVTVPVLVTVAMDVLPLLHVPPLVGSVYTVVEPTHTLAAPLMADGEAITEIVLKAVHPVPRE
jgi:hypothetical protein